MANDHREREQGIDPPIDARPLFPRERAALLDLLASLHPPAWRLPTPCLGWSVHDLALHLLGDDVGLLAGRRDDWANPSFAEGLDVGSWSGLVAAIDRQNARWVVAARRLSPTLTIELLRWTGERTQAFFASVDPFALGMPVSWAGPEPAPVWFDLAREFTERWIHQQHLRDAVGQPGLTGAGWLRPVLATFALGLPHALRDGAAPPGARLRLTLTGPGGSDWELERQQDVWVFAPISEVPVRCRVELAGATAWRLWTRALAPEAARAKVDGDPTLADRVLRMTTIIA